MKSRQKKQAEKRAKYFFLLTIARIVAEITIIIGFFIFIYFMVRRYL
jgi:hypothetical protein